MADLDCAATLLALGPRAAIATTVSVAAMPASAAATPTAPALAIAALAFARAAMTATVAAFTARAALVALTAVAVTMTMAVALASAATTAIAALAATTVIFARTLLGADFRRRGFAAEKTLEPAEEARGLLFRHRRGGRLAERLIRARLEFPRLTGAAFTAFTRTALARATLAGTTRFAGLTRLEGTTFTAALATVG